MPEIAFPDPTSPAFLTRRTGSGDFVRAGSDIALGEAAAVIRYDVPLPKGFNNSLFVSRPYGYEGIQIWWGIPPEVVESWTQMVITRSGFGHPSVPTDGQIIYRLYASDLTVTQEEEDAGITENDKVPGTVIDLSLPQGKWFYYTLFFRVGNRWYGVQQTENLVPVDYDHRSKLLDMVPPFYLYQENQDGTDFIDRWMSVIGYDLDLTRTLTEGIEKIYDPDTSPMALMESLGKQNFGFNIPSGLGDIRYRSIIAKTREISERRGTALGLQTYVEAALKTTAYVTPGVNEMLLVDDAEFHVDTGNWAPAPWNIANALFAGDKGEGDGSAAVDVAPTRRVTVAKDDTYLPPTEIPSARGVAKVLGNGDHMIITCGAGQKRLVTGVDSVRAEKLYDEIHLDPAFRGIPVDAGETYYFSFYMRRNAGDTAAADTTVFGFAMFGPDSGTNGFSDGFKKDGFDSWMNHPIVSDFASAVDLAEVPNATPETGWLRYVASFAIPDDDSVRFVVPVIWVQGPTYSTVVSTPRYITGCMVTKSQGLGASTVYLPDNFLRLVDDTGSEHVLGSTTKVLGEI